MSDIKWYGEDKDPSIVIQSVAALAVYTNPSGDIVIRQEGPNGEDDSIIVFPKSHADAVMNAIQKELEAD